MGERGEGGRLRWAGGRSEKKKHSPAAKCKGVDLRPAVSLALTVLGVTNFLTRTRSPVLQASKSSLKGSAAAPDPVRDSGFVNTDRRPAISHRHFYATVMPPHAYSSSHHHGASRAATAFHYSIFHFTLIVITRMRIHSRRRRRRTGQ